MTTLSLPQSVAELLERLGDIPAERVMWFPRPGTAKELDLLRYLEHDKRRCELIDSTLVEKPTGHRESSLASWLIIFIGQFLQEHPVGQIYGSDGPFRLRRGRVRLPDVADVSFDRLPDGPKADQPIASWAPDLAVEVLSTGNTRKEMQTKLAEYFHSGVRLIWIIDPKSRTIRVCQPGKPEQKLTEQDMLSGDEVLPGFQLSLNMFFGKIEGKRRR